VPAELRLVAVSDKVDFTEAEFKHLQICKACFSLFEQFLEDNDSEKNQKSD